MNEAKWELVGQGSSKDLYLLSEGRIAFAFSDRVSVFDYGALPELIPGKGAALEKVALLIDGVFRAAGLRTASDPELSARLDAFVSEVARHPKFPDLAHARDARLEFIPLEVIFRFGVVPGSSLLKRRADLKPYQEFAQPLVEFSTKLEASDRMLDNKEALALAGGEERFARLTRYAEKAALLLRDTFRRAGLKLWDGKIECAYDLASGEIVMVDAITPDEVRLTFPGLDDVPLSKELLRQWLGLSPWGFEVARAKRSGVADWKKNVSAPPRLGPWRVQKLAGLYRALAVALETQKALPLFNWLREDPVAPRVWIVGQGGREAALRWRLRAEGCQVARSAQDADAVFLSRDADLAAGLANELNESRAWVFGATRVASKLEWSKAFGREVAIEAGVPVPQSRAISAAKLGREICDEDLRHFARPPVVKLDGLAEGKGVVVPETWEQALAAAQELSRKGELLLEERLRGFEASAFFALHSGYNGVECRLVGTAKDFKRRFPGDEGPNTGGMGAYAPHPDLTDEDLTLFKKWAAQVGQVMARKNLPYNGILYMGLLKDETRGWCLLEFNARPGDPETQALTMQWPAGPVLRNLLQLSPGGAPNVMDSDLKAVCLSLVHPGYPAANLAPLQLPALPTPEEDMSPHDAHEMFSSRLEFFATASRTGRLGYLVGAGETFIEAGDRVFEALTTSPWKDAVDWRADLLP